MPSIKVKQIRFGVPPFRKLSNMTIEFADRITVIAGHNGIGKSTIMALVANNSGLSSSQAYKSLFGKAFQGNLFDIVHVDYVKEYLTYKNAGAALPEPLIDSLINGADVVTKACSTTGRSDSKKARVVPRSVPHEAYESDDGKIAIGPDAKVPLPTIYLGMTRMFPVGEANPSWVDPAIDKTLEVEERQFISKFINDVVVGSKTTSDTITSLGIKGTGKLAKHPQYDFDARCVSLGQDSLGSIATALASFSRLKRKWPDYPGGLFIVDEVDAGLHPHAQRKLIQALQSTGRKLDLQIVATTHSTHVIEEVHPDGQGHAQAPDGVIYLMDTAVPRHANGFSLMQILDDMNLKMPEAPKKPKPLEVKVYFEDDEAAFIFNRLVPPKKKNAIGKKLGVKLSPMPLGVGCNSLVGLSKHDKYFEKVVIAVDADASITGAAKQVANVVKLPGATNDAGKGLSPERTLYYYLQELVDNPGDHAEEWDELLKRGLSTNQVQANLLDGGFNIAKREGAKSWWQARQQSIKDQKLFEFWASWHPDEVNAFLDGLEKAVEVVAKRLG
ncbi:hypothetical protein B0E52_00035 [Rhodanobacter sp. C06]|uniref:ATP-dependent nuclease n=1 Tax=Rhodanobacter sp. C06 TaxID=1945854 RepID=UPI000984FFBE|nr:ATP-binding protein [Rhodanobacter sp. C06]OOG51420.1 hypothetical protein B0E52_00035 [Rhodanobacter sp. C06]